MTHQLNRRDFLKTAGPVAATLALTGCLSDKNLLPAEKTTKKPNILWLIAEDMSPHWGCYGEKIIQTPNIDRLAAEGVLFRNAFVTAPVCSPSRSAMITAMHQTTIGAHHHRSSYPGSKIHLPQNIKLLPDYLKQHSYYTANGGPKTTVYHADIKRDKKLGKTDYNFVWDPAVYDDSDWINRPPHRPFFAQIQLRGGKHRRAEVPNPVDPADVKLPPYYPDHPVIRADWARYLNSVIYLDEQVGNILKRLDDEGIAQDTVVILWTDHGISHARGKQFLYDEGIHVPLIIRWPGVTKPGSIRDDLVSHIDIAATSLYMAGIPIPRYIQGRPLFGPQYKPRRYVFAARDRCDETLDCIRCVRTHRYKYIRNFYPQRPHLQHNRYKDNKPIIKLMRQLFAEGKLNRLQATVFVPTRPPEELYDLQTDPFETRNLADSAAHKNQLEKMRRTLLEWMHTTCDLGLVPEPMLESFAAKYDSRYAILRDRKNKKLLDGILDVIQPADLGDCSVDRLIEKMNDSRPSVRWWAARKLSALGDKAGPAEPSLTVALWDGSPGVRVASARALCIIGAEHKGLPVLVRELKNSDQVVRHYAALALEDIGSNAYPALDALRAAKKDRYEYVRRIADRLVPVLEQSR